MWLLWALVLCLPCGAAFAEDRMLRLETRVGAKIPFYYMKRGGATHSLILLPGGSGGIGALVEGKPSGANFLVRARDLFADAGFNVAVMARPTDKDDLDYPDRLADWHLEDIRKLVDFLRQDSGLPVWLVGTSRGTVSATAAALSFGREALAGIVLTSSVVSYRVTVALPRQDLAALRIPVLLVHHERDECRHCRPHELPAVLAALTHAPSRKLLMVGGGGAPTGDPCEAMHFHGFIGIEQGTVARIVEWIRAPAD